MFTPQILICNRYLEPYMFKLTIQLFCRNINKILICARELSIQVVQ